MDQKFKFESKWEKRSKKEKRMKWLSDIACRLYQNPVIQFLNLDSNPVIQSAATKTTSGHPFPPNPLPKDHSVKPAGFSFFDIVPLEEFDEFQKRFSSLIQQLHPGGHFEAERNLKYSFHNFTQSYNRYSYGSFLKHVTPDLREEGDFIKSVSFKYIKGPHHTFILEYFVEPSLKFLEKFDELIVSPEQHEHLIHFYPLGTILKKWRLARRSSTAIIPSGHLVQKLIQDLNFQVKMNFGERIRLGLFQNSEDHLFPSVAHLEVKKEDFNQHKEEIAQALDIEGYFSFANTEKDIAYYFPAINIASRATQNMFLFLLKAPSKGKRASDTNSSYSRDTLRAAEYINALAPVWCQLNSAGYFQARFLYQHRTTFKYLNKNSDSLFLSRGTKLKREITLDHITISRITADYNNVFFRRRFASFELPDAQETSLYTNPESGFHDAFWNEMEFHSKDIVKEYKYLHDLFMQISDDNLIHSNLKIQRILIVLAIIGVVVAAIGIILTIYAANVEFFNSILKETFGGYIIDF